MRLGYQILVGWAACCCVLRADWREPFEGPEISWHEAGGDVRFKIENHQRVAEGAHGGRWCEQLRVVGNNGSAVYLRHDVPPARLIAELTASVWIKADRAGLQLLVRAVLPRSQDPRKGGPITTLLAGSGYTQAGNWQQLRIDNLPQRIERELRVLRAQFGPSVDAREAYIDQVVLNVYGGPGTTNVSIDDLELTGAVGGAAVSGGQAASAATNDFNPARDIWPISSVKTTAPGAAQAAARSAVPDVVIRGSLLLVGGKPFFPRMIEHRGEPLARLQALGFNTVRVAREPAPEMLAEAARLGIWIVSPPPSWIGDAAAGHGVAIGPEYNAVLAWDLGSGLSERELETVRHWSKGLRAADPRNRPLLCGSNTSLREYSRLADILWHGRPVLGTSLELSEYARWLRDRQLLARPGTPIWSNVQTQPLAPLQQQANLLAGQAVTMDRLQDDQLRQMMYAALAAGARGLCFESATPLDAQDAVTKRRAELLELINLELDLIEPWAAAGNFVTTAASNDPQTQAAVIQTERGRLLLPLHTRPQSQITLGSSIAPTTSYVVPGVPDTNDAYELTPAGMRPIGHSRVSGGLRVSLGAGHNGSLVVLTQDAQVVNYLLRRTAQMGSRAATLQKELAESQLQFVMALDRRLTTLGRGLPTLQLSVVAAQAALREAEAPAGALGPLPIYAAARRGVGSMQQVERAYWEKGAGLTPNWLASPLATNVATMPDQWLLAVELASRRPGPNQLAGGEFENLQRMLQAGWRHTENKLPAIVTDAALMPELPHGGKLSLRLKASTRPKDPTPQPAILEMAPISVTTPALPIRAGQIAWIHGWVRLEAGLGATVDGLLITDSLGGDALAERFGPTHGWQDAERFKQGLKPVPIKKKSDKDKKDKKKEPEKPRDPGAEPEILEEDWREFSLYRAAPQAGQLTLTFALTGLGEAWLDDVTIQMIDRNPPSMPQAAAAPVNPGYPTR